MCGSNYVVIEECVKSNLVKLEDCVQILNLVVVNLLGCGYCGLDLDG